MLNCINRHLQPVAGHRSDGGDEAGQCNEQPSDLDEQPSDLDEQPLSSMVRQLNRATLRIRE
jgi:hypothetical protein